MFAVRGPGRGRDASRSPRGFLFHAPLTLVAGTREATRHAWPELHTRRSHPLIVILPMPLPAPLTPAVHRPDANGRAHVLLTPALFRPLRSTRGRTLTGPARLVFFVSLSSSSKGLSLVGWGKHRSLPQSTKTTKRWYAVLAVRSSDWTTPRRPQY